MTEYHKMRIARFKLQSIYFLLCTVRVSFIVSERIKEYQAVLEF